MTNSKNLIIAAIVILSLAIALVVYGYTTSSSNSLARVLKMVLPAGWVGDNVISIYDWEENLAIAKRLDSTVSQDVMVEKMIRRIKEKILTEEIVLPWKDGVAKELEFYVSNNPESYPGFLTQYFSNSERLFVKYVIEPSAIDAGLRTHFNSRQKDSAQLVEANQILNKILAGEKFEDLAKQLSDDKVSAQFGGDLGFFKDGQILPELAEQIKKGPVGEVQKEVFVSRIGFHIVYPVETAEKDGVKYWHGKHILIVTDGYDQWLDEQTKDIKVRYLGD